MPERNVLPKPVQKPAPAAVGHGHEPGHRMRRRRPRARLPGRRRRRLRRAGAAYRRVLPPHRAVRPRRRRRDREVTTLNFLYCHEDAATAAEVGMGMVGGFGLANSHLLWTREAYPTRAYQSLGNLAPGAGRARVGRSGRRVRHPRGHLRRRPRHHHRGAAAVGVDRRDRHQLPAERARDRSRSSRCSTACGCSPARSCRGSGGA